MARNDGVLEEKYFKLRQSGSGGELLLRNATILGLAGCDTRKQH